MAWPLFYIFFLSKSVSTKKRFFFVASLREFTLYKEYIAEDSLQSGNSQAQSYCKHLGWEILQPNNTASVHTHFSSWSYGPIILYTFELEIPQSNYTAYALFLIFLFMTQSYKTRNVLEPHGPSMCTLSLHNTYYKLYILYPWSNAHPKHVKKN